MASPSPVALQAARRFTGRSILGLALLVVAAVGFGVLLSLLRLGWPPLARWDAGSATAMHEVLTGHPVVRAGLRGVATLGRDPVMWWMATVTAAGMVIRRQLRLAAYLAVTGLGSLALTPITRLLVRSLTPIRGSFPSGHAVNGTVFYGALLLVFLPVVPRRLRGLAAAVLGSITIAVCLAHLALDRARVSDVVAGCLVGVGWLAVTVHAFRLWRTELGRPAGPLADGLEPESAPTLAPTHATPPPLAWRTALRVLVAWMAVAGMFVAVGALVARRPPPFDTALSHWLASHRTGEWTAASDVVSQAGSARWIVAVALVVAPLIIARIQRWRPGIFLAAVLAGQLGLFVTVAAAVGRPRPWFVSGFPSGRSMAAVCLYGAIAVILVPRIRRWARWTVLTAAVLVPVVVALSEMYRGEHPLLEVSAGMVPALLWLGAVSRLLKPNVDLADPRPPVNGDEAADLHDPRPSRPVGPVRPVARFVGRSAAGLAAVVVFGAGLIILPARIAGRWPSLTELDGTITAQLHRLVSGRPGAVAALTWVADLGAASVVWWLAIVGSAVMLVRRRPRLATYLAVTGLGGLALTPMLGLVTEVLAPAIAAAPVSPVSDAAMNATVVYGALLLVFAPATRHLRRAPVGLAVAIIAGAGLATLVLGTHLASAVVVGWVAGAAWLAATTYAFRRWRAESGLPPAAVTAGLEPEAVPDLTLVHEGSGRNFWVSGGWLLASWAAIAGVLYAVGILVTRQAPNWDEGLPRLLAAGRGKRLDAFSDVLSRLGNTHWILTVALVIAPLAVAYHRRWRPAVFLAVTMFGELGLFLLTDDAVGRPRPQVSHLDGHLPTASFPSGHTAATTCLYGALAILVLANTRSRWRWLVLAPAVSLPLLVGWSRIYRGEHHPLDVTGGMLLALLWLAAVTVLMRPTGDPPAAPDPAGVEGPARPAIDGSTPAGRRSAVVANPARVADLPDRRAHITAALTGAGWAAPLWLETTPRDPGGGQARAAVAAGVDVVFAAGGDGTVRACLDPLRGTDTALAVLPFGTGNLLAVNFGVPADLPGALRVATGPHRRRVDLGVVDDRCFAVMAGIGLDAEMLHDAPAALKARIGWLAYVAAATRHLCRRPMRATVRLDDHPPLTRPARTVLVGNVGRLQGGIRLLPLAVPDDGLLDVAVLMPPRRRDWLPLAWSLVRQRPFPPTLEIFRARRVEIISDRVQRRELDGDLIEPADSLVATVHPGALWLCVPPTSRENS
jgi:diacylglycerol kinase family enzyme/membrane-associated phospholipid phosphatase